MAQVEITVRGQHRVEAPPERATVQLQVGLEGGSSREVYDAVARSANEATETIKPLHRPDQGPVTWWSSDRLRTWASRPWDKDGKQLPLRHHAVVDFQVKFSDFEQLGTWLGGVSDIRGASVQHVGWALTVARRDRLVAEVRAAAVRDAVDRAQAYADALGLGLVRAVQVADAGMLGEGLHPSQGGAVAMAASRVRGGDGGDVQFRPQDVAVAAEVDARFVAETA